MTIAFHDHGEGDPIVWIHGFPLSSAVFEPQTAIAGYRHIRPDLPGFGATPAMPETSMASYARDVLGVLDLLQLDRAAVAGLSMGGYVVMQMLREAPERISAVLLLDTRETADSDEARQNRSRQAEEVEKHGIASVVEAMLPKMVVSDAARAPVRAIMESASPAGVAAALRAMAVRRDSTDVLRNIRVPSLIVAGEHDSITPPADARRMQSLIPGAALEIIPGAAHLANFEQPDAFNRALLSFRP